MYNDAHGVIASLHDGLDRLDTWLHGRWATRIFWQSVRVRWYTPPVSVSRTYELDEPYRRARPLLLRFSPGKALVLGIWGKRVYDEQSNLLDATIMGRTRSDEERLAYDESRAYDSRDSSGDVLPGRSGLRDGATRHAGDVVDGRYIRGPE